MNKIVGILLISLFLLSCGSGKAIFPKKYLGKYEGNQSTYVVNNFDQEIIVPAESYQISLQKDRLWLISQNQTLEATFSLLKETPEHYRLLVRFTNGLVEEWDLIKANKSILRHGISPKPDIHFVKEN